MTIQKTTMLKPYQTEFGAKFPSADLSVVQEFRVLVLDVAILPELFACSLPYPQYMYSSAFE